VRLPAWLARLADVRICRIAGVSSSYTYAPDCKSLTVAAIINSALSCVRERAEGRIGADSGVFMDALTRIADLPDLDGPSGANWSILIPARVMPERSAWATMTLPGASEVVRYAAMVGTCVYVAAKRTA
jgi:hypothetical protein